MSEAEFVSRGYYKLPETKFFEPTQVQLIKMKNSSDTEWTVSGGYRASFKHLLDKAAHGSDEIVTELDFTYSFTRPVAYFFF